MFVVRRERPRVSEVVQPERAVVFHEMRPMSHPQPSGTKREPARWRPPIEVYETRAELVVCAEIAAIDRESLEVTVDGDLLLIRGERPAKCSDARRSYHESRIVYGSFGAAIPIPFPVDAESTEAEYEDGFLRIVLPRGAARTIIPRRSDNEAVRGEGAK